VLIVDLLHNDGTQSCGDCVAEAEAAAAALEEDDPMGEEEDEVAFVCDDCGENIMPRLREGWHTIGRNKYCDRCFAAHVSEESDEMSNNSSSDGERSNGERSDGEMSNGEGMYGGSISSKKNTRSTHSKNKRKNLKSRLTKKLKMKGANNRKKRRTLRKK